MGTLIQGGLASVQAPVILLYSGSLIEPFSPWAFLPHPVITGGAAHLFQDPKVPSPPTWSWSHIKMSLQAHLSRTSCAFFRLR